MPPRKPLFFLLGVTTAVLVALLLLSDATLLLDPFSSSAGVFDTRILLRRGDDRRNLFGGKQIGTVKVDFYRTFEEIDLWLFKYKAHSISKLRLYKELHLINHWFAGRVKFEMGDIISYDNPEMHDTTMACAQLDEFARSSDVRHLDRISAIIIRRQERTPDSMCDSSGLFTPLGSGFTSDTVAPAVVVGMTVDQGVNLPFLGFTLGFGGTLAMRIAHLMGFEHTVSVTQGNEGVRVFNECGDTIFYPYFSTNDPTDDEVFNPITNETYYHPEWKGRSNLMAPITTTELFFSNIFTIGLYVNKYAEVFEAITQCWFDSAITTP